MMRVKFADGEYYHIYNRGTEKRNIFLGPDYYARFLYTLYACNDKNPLLNSKFHYRGLTSIEGKDSRALLVDIVCFCLMPNHFHLLLRQKVDEGVSLFMQKVGTGYTMYFNLKQQRVGGLFQGSFKAKHINREAYFTHVTRYIHLNPLDLYEPEWRERGIGDLSGACQYLKRYRWSSYSDYLGERRFAPLLNFELVKDLYRTPAKYETFMKEWMSDDLNMIADYIIDY